MLKVKAKQRERAIRLSDMGKTLVPDLFQASYPLPGYTALPRYQQKSRMDLIFSCLLIKVYYSVLLVCLPPFWSSSLFL
jgi:hypothetical protein